jgi:hypothetical protein
MSSRLRRATVLLAALAATQTHPSLAKAAAPAKQHPQTSTTPSVQPMTVRHSSPVSNGRKAIRPPIVRDAPPPPSIAPPPQEPPPPVLTPEPIAPAPIRPARPAAPPN